MALGTAFRAFFSALGNRQIADQIRLVLDQPTGTAALPAPPADVAAPSKDAAASSKPTPPVLKPKESMRSDAITLLATLQREARLLDLVKENLSAYSDAQVGAAARPCLTQCAATLDRVLGVKAIESASDGQAISVPESTTPSRYTWIGEGSGSTGKLVHHGWEASRVDLPHWTGVDADAHVIAPAQVQRA